VNPDHERPVLAIAGQVEIKFLALMSVRDILDVSRDTRTFWQGCRLAQSERCWQHRNKNGGDGNASRRSLSGSTCHRFDFAVWEIRERVKSVNELVPGFVIYPPGIGHQETFGARLGTTFPLLTSFEALTL
jgi:hypothetical protein